MKLEKLTYNQYWGEYWRITSRHRIPGIAQWDQDLVDFIERQCRLHPPASILDLGCAGGDQARLFSHKGYSVTGIDLAPSLIAYAQEVYQQERLSGHFLVADMRQIEYCEAFDLCVMLSGTFGLPSDEDNRIILQRIYRSLRHGGQAFIDYLPLERYCQRQHSRSWHDIDGGYGLHEEWFHAATSTYRTRNKHIFLDGRIVEPAEEDTYSANEIIRCFGAREMELNAESVGFRVQSHICRRQMKQDSSEPDEAEPKGMVLLRKQ